MSFKMAELDRYPGHRMEDGGARKRGGILRSTHGTLIISEQEMCLDRYIEGRVDCDDGHLRDEWICCDDGHLLMEGTVEHGWERECGQDMMGLKQDKGGVWSIHSTEVELWDVWTDIHCNDGHLLLDRIRDVFGPLHSTNRSRALGRVDRHWL